MKWTRWTEELIREKAKECKNKRDFHTRFRGAEKAAIKLGIIDDVFPVLGKKFWTDEMLKVEASKYVSRGAFLKGNNSAYTLAVRRKLIDKICPPAKNSPKRIWTDETIRKEAAKYKSRSLFEEGSSSAYQAAHRYGLIESVCPLPIQGTSSKEHELLDFLKTLLPDFKTKRFANDFELDCYSERLNLGVEFNGLYWHSDTNKSKNYHLNKTKYFEEKGIRVIHIWEYEWKERRSQVCSYLRSACGMNEIRIGARKCEFREVVGTIARDFLNDMHIQGAPHNIKLAIGCYYKSILVGVCTFGLHHRNSNQIVLNRFACLENYTISGFLAKASKLGFNKFQVPIYSWADRAKSQGKGYIASGWKLLSYGNTDYFYATKYGVYVSKQSRKKSNVNTPKEMTEIQHARADGLYRIWDCGKILLVYDPVSGPVHT